MMDFVGARYDSRGSVVVTVDGVEMVVPADPANRHYAEMTEQGVTVAPYVAPPAPIPDLSFAQMLTGLVAQGWITEAEGDAWLEGTLPAAVLGLIAGLPAEQRFAAKARAARPSVVERSNPLVLGLAAIQGVTEAQMDAFFIAYAQV